MVTLSGFTMTQNELLYNMQAAVTKNTYTGQAVISTIATTNPRCLIPAGYWTAPGKSMKIKAAMSIANTAAATFTLAAAFDTVAGTINGTGGGTLFTTAALTPTAAITTQLDLDMDVTATAVGNSSTLQCNGYLRATSAVQSGAWNTTSQQAAVATTLTGINSEISLFLELWGNWSASSSSNTTTLQIFKVYGEN